MNSKTLLIAAAALAAGIITSEAQVYSQNVVGYVNTVIPGGNALSMVANPLVGPNGTNGAESVLTGLVGGENLFLWNGHGYYIYNYAGPAVGTGLGYQSDWIDSNGGTSAAVSGDQNDTADGVYWAPQPQLNQGIGFFLQNPNTAFTNTYVGTVVLQNTNTPVVLTGGNALVMVSSVIPIGGSVANTNFNLPFSGGENLFFWNGHGYYIYNYAGLGVGTGLGYQSDYIDSNGGTSAAAPGDQNDTADGVYWAPVPSPTVGQGFFVQNPNPTENWSQNLILQ